MNKITKKKNWKVIVLRTFASIFLAFQILAYFNTPSTEEFSSGAETIGYYIGYNFFLYISIALFYWAWKIKQKNAKIQHSEAINSIGEEIE